MERSRRITVLGILLLCSFCWGNEVTGASSFPQAPVQIPFYPTPTDANLCGERIPLHLPDVWERFDREFTIVAYSHAQVYLWLKRKERYFPRLEERLRYHQLPDDLKYVAVAESDLLWYARSPKGATGSWQFMGSTGKRYGLNQSGSIDERRDFEMATESALRYLKDLHGRFQDWLLAIAAYNCGEGRIKSEMAKQKVNSYHLMELPSETERYIFRILAIKTVLSHPERYGYQLPKEAAYPKIPTDRVDVSLPYAVPVQRVAEAAGITYREFKIMNPAFISDTVPSGSYMLQVPEGKGETFRNRMCSLVTSYKPEPGLVYHTVGKGENLNTIGHRYKVSIADLKKWNTLHGNKVRKGQKLKIYR